MADEATTTTAAAPAEAVSAPVGESVSNSTAGDTATSTNAGVESTTPSGAPEATTTEQSTPSLISTADADKAKPEPAKEIGDKVPDADPAKPATADTEAPPKDAPSSDKPDGETAPAETAPAPSEQQARSYEAFTVPEGITLADKETKEFTDLLDDGKLSHQERGQKLVDLYVRESQRIVKDIQTQQQKAWSDFTEGLKADFKADPELGGNRQDTTLGVAKAVIERFGGNDEQKSDLYAMLDHTGMGNHKGLVRVLNNIFETYMRESSKTVPGNPPSLRNARDRQSAFYGTEAG